jgi:hypothetical protein
LYQLGTRSRLQYFRLPRIADREAFVRVAFPAVAESAFIGNATGRAKDLGDIDGLG